MRSSFSRTKRVLLRTVSSSVQDQPRPTPGTAGDKGVGGGEDRWQDHGEREGGGGSELGVGRDGEYGRPEAETMDR